MLLQEDEYQIKNTEKHIDTKFMKSQLVLRKNSQLHVKKVSESEMKFENFTQRKTDLNDRNFASSFNMCKGTVDKLNKNSKKMSGG